MRFFNQKSEIINHQSSIINFQRGFTLIEIAMVLVVIGILLGLGTGMMGMLTKRAKLIDSREVVKTAKEALSGYAVKNGFLPATIAPTGARELDAWQRPLVYALPASLSGSGNACGLTATDRTIYECTNAACSTSNTKPNIAFIVYSTGEDADGLGTTTKPTAAPACPAGTCYWIREQATSDASYTLEYDDIVQYVTLDEIRNARSCSQQLAITSSTTLLTGVEDTFYSYQMQAIGGSPPYTWTAGGPWNGVTMNSSGLLSGVINVNAATTTGDLTACTGSIPAVSSSVTDSAGSTAAAYLGTIPVNTQPLNITTQTLPDSYVGVVYNIGGLQLNGTGGRTPYSAWTTGQAQGACAAGSVQIVATSIGLCLNTTSGLISGTPTTAGTYNFTVTLNDTCTTTSKKFTLNALDTTIISGINLVNTSGTRYFKRNLNTTGVQGCSAVWANNSNLYAQAGSSYSGIRPNDTFYFFTNATCTTRVCTTLYPPLGGISYGTAKLLDINVNGHLRATLTSAAVCTLTDL